MDWMGAEATQFLACTGVCHGVEQPSCVASWYMAREVSHAPVVPPDSREVSIRLRHSVGTLGPSVLLSALEFLTNHDEVVGH